VGDHKKITDCSTRWFIKTGWKLENRDQINRKLSDGAQAELITRPKAKSNKAKAKPANAASYQTKPGAIQNAYGSNQHG
jgi:hypothetical protein